MRTAETLSGLAAFERRGAGTDAERRAAAWLRHELEDGGREAATEPIWCRPNWAAAHAWHVATALAGSLLAVGTPWLGCGLIALALASLIADARFGRSAGRRLTFERASQNVVAPAPALSSDREPRVRLILTANYDAARTGIAYANVLRRAATKLGAATRAPGWLGWLAIAFVWLEAVAIARATGSKGTAIAVAQLVPTVGLVLGLALLLELAIAGFGPSANDNASGVAVAIAIARALDAAPPRHVAVDVVLAGAGDGQPTGLGLHLKARKRTLTNQNTVVVGIAPTGAGEPRWWVSDGPLLPLAYFAQLRSMCSDLAAGEPELHAHPHRGRGTTPALAARLRHLPAITIGALDDSGLAPRSHQPGDTPDSIDTSALDRAVEFGLLLVDAIDASLRPAATPSTAPASM